MDLIKYYYQVVPEQKRFRSCFRKMRSASLLFGKAGRISFADLYRWYRGNTTLDEFFPVLCFIESDQ